MKRMHFSKTLFTLTLAVSACAQKQSINQTNQAKETQKNSNQTHMPSPQTLTEPKTSNRIHASTAQTTAELRFPKEFDAISSQDTIYSQEVVNANMLPRGSALLTQSGNLHTQGITAILHAASGSAGRGDPQFIPTLEGVELSVKNSLTLAQQHGHKRIAIPFIGSGIFLSRVGATRQQLADTIVRAALESRGNLEIQFVIIGKKDVPLFTTSLDEIKKKPDFQSLQPNNAQIQQGDILDFKLHGATAIINAANMEVQFGGGISGAIGNATGKSAKIDDEARELIRLFNARVSEMLK